MTVSFPWGNNHKTETEIKLRETLFSFYLYAATHQQSINLKIVFHAYFYGLCLVERHETRPCVPCQNQFKNQNYAPGHSIIKFSVSLKVFK